MKLEAIKKWVKDKLSAQAFNIDLISSLNRQIHYKNELLFDFEKTNERILFKHKALEEQCKSQIDEIGRKRIALIFITTLLIVSLVGNAIQYFA